MKQGVICSLVIAVFLMVSAKAETLVEFNDASYTARSGKGIGLSGLNAPASAVSTNVKVSALYRGSVSPGFSGTAGGSVFWRTDGTPDSEKDSVEEGDYWFFTVTPKNGVLLNLNTVSFEFGGSDPSAVGDFDVTAYVQIDAGNGFVTVGSKTITISQKSPNNNVNQDILAVDLSGTSYQSLAGSVTVRVGAYASVKSSHRYIRGQDIILTGITASAQ